MASVPPAPSFPSGLLPDDLLPATILCVRNPTDVSGKAIELGEALLGLPDSTHIAMVHHQDDKGTIWCLEARPGGVGWRDATAYLRSPYTIANIGQPIPAAVRLSIAREGERLLGTDYDWLGGIAQDAFRDLGIEDKWGQKWGPLGVPPAHFVCSSYAAWLYAHFSQTCPLPADLEHVEPGDWTKLILLHGWEARAT